MNRALVINVGVCSFICVTIILFELFFYSSVFNSILYGIYFSLPLGMIALTIIELSFYKKKPLYIHIVNIIKFDIFFMLAVLSLIVEVAKALNITINIGLNDIIAGLATLVALDRVLVYAKIAFTKKRSFNSSAQRLFISTNKRYHKRHL